MALNEKLYRKRRHQEKQETRRNWKASVKEDFQQILKVRNWINIHNAKAQLLMQKHWDNNHNNNKNTNNNNNNNNNPIILQNLKGWSLMRVSFIQLNLVTFIIQ